jgi:hypothetical protein
MRKFYDADQIAGIIAVMEGYDPATMTYHWKISDDGAFEGIVIMHASPKDRAA